MLCWWSNKHNLRKKMSYNKESFVQTSLGFVVRIKRQTGIEFNIFILQIFSFPPLYTNEPQNETSPQSKIQGIF